MIKQWGDKEKQKFIDSVSKLVHDLKNPFTRFTLFPSYLPQGEVIPSKLKEETLGSIQKVQELQLQLEQLLTLYLDQITDPKAFAMHRELKQLFLRFYAAATDFMNEEQPQKEAGEVGGQIIIAAVDLEEHLEKKIGHKTTYSADTVKEMAKLTAELADRAKKRR
ncbi:hypothetical protein HYT55_00885 [Candidatus Woesearchaeota archaeon]|nr:hypothetical protein [Candidatus Woesearchaeota archaeon]